MDRGWCDECVTERDECAAERDGADCHDTIHLPSPDSEVSESQGLEFWPYNFAVSVSRHVSIVSAESPVVSGGGPLSDFSLCLLHGPDSGQPFLCGP